MSLRNIILAMTTTLQLSQAQLSLGTASTYGALAYSYISNAGSTQIQGNIGTASGGSINGFPPGIVTGSINAAGASTAFQDCKAAYNTARALHPIAVLPNTLPGPMIAPGIYTFGGGAVTLIGKLALNGASNPNGQFIFLIPGIFQMPPRSVIRVINGAQACNVFFVARGVVMDTSASVQGNILAEAIQAGYGVSGSGTWCAVASYISLIQIQLQALSGSCTRK